MIGRFACPPAPRLPPPRPPALKTTLFLEFSPLGFDPPFTTAIHPKQRNAARAFETTLNPNPKP